MRNAPERARSAIFAPIGDEGRAVRVENRLAEAIRSGMLGDGERLPSEPELAQMLGVATVTAREALIALRAQGLVETVRGRGGGSFVRSPDTEDLISTRLAAMSRVEVRDRGSYYAVIAAGCAELAAQRADTDDVDELRELMVEPSETEIGRWRAAESELHLSLATLTHSARLTREAVRLEADFGTLLRLPLDQPEFRANSHQRHTRLLDALSEADSSAARESVREHVNDALEHLADLHAAVQ